MKFVSLKSVLLGFFVVCLPSGVLARSTDLVLLDACKELGISKQALRRMIPRLGSNYFLNSGYAQTF